MSENIYPRIGEGHEAHYFPPLYGMPDCAKCERKRTCFSREKFQRNLRDFTYTSGRCPRLPDRRGFVEADEHTQYAATFPLVLAKRTDENELLLTLFLPRQKRGRKVKLHTFFKRWWVRMRKDGWTQRRFLTIEGGRQNPQEILNYMDCYNTNSCIFRCELGDWF